MMTTTGMLSLMALLAFLRVTLAHNEMLEVSRTSENPGNHSIGPIFFCRVDLLTTKFVEKGRSSRHGTYALGRLASLSRPIAVCHIEALAGTQINPYNCKGAM